MVHRGRDAGIFLSSLCRGARYRSYPVLISDGELVGGISTNVRLDVLE